MNSEQYEERIARLSTRIEELENQLSEQFVTKDLQIVDQSNRVRIRMYCDDDGTALLETYDEKGVVRHKLSASVDGTSRYQAFSYNAHHTDFCLDASVTAGRLGTIRLTAPENPGVVKRRELIVGASEDMMVGMQVKIDNQEKVLVGIDNTGEPKVRLTQADGSVNEITANKP